MKRSMIIGGLGATLLLGACSTADLTVPGASLQLTATDSAMVSAISAADATAEDVDIMTASEGSLDAVSFSFDRVGGPSFSTASVGSDSTRSAFWAFIQACTYNDTTGRFGCPDVVKNGLTLSRSAALSNAAGAPMSRYNDTATASANFQISVQGVHSDLLGADTISRQRTMTVSGLAGRETARTWNGTGTRNDAGFRQDSTKTFTYRTLDNVTFANVVVSLPRILHPWPMSGVVTRQISGSAKVVVEETTRSFSVSKTVTITFNGTRLVPMLVGTIPFTLDLYTGKVVKN